MILLPSLLVSLIHLKQILKFYYIPSSGLEVKAMRSQRLNLGPLEVHNHIKETQKRDPGARSVLGRWEGKLCFSLKGHVVLKTGRSS